MSRAYRPFQTGSRFSAKARAITCPYHSWSYKLDGQLFSAAGYGGFESFDMSDFPLRPLAIAPGLGHSGGTQVVEQRGVAVVSALDQQLLGLVVVPLGHGQGGIHRLQVRLAATARAEPALRLAAQAEDLTFMLTNTSSYAVKAFFTSPASIRPRAY